MQVNSNFYARSRQTDRKTLDYFDYFVTESHTGHRRAESTSGHDCTLAGCFGPFQMLASLITRISEYMYPEPQLIDENAFWSGGNSDHFKPDNASAITAKTWQKRAEKILHGQLQQMRKREQTTQKKDWKKRKKHETPQWDSDQQLQQLADWFSWDTGHMWRHGNTAVSRGSLRQITQSSAQMFCIMMQAQKRSVCFLKRNSQVLCVSRINRTIIIQCILNGTRWKHEKRPSNLTRNSAAFWTNRSTCWVAWFQRINHEISSIMFLTFSYHL